MIQSCSYSRIALALLAALTLALLLIAGCTHRPQGPDVAALTAATADGYVGNAACAECHSAEFAEHRSSRHAATLHTMDAALPAEYKPPLGQVPSTQIAIQARGTGYVCTRSRHEDKTLPLHLVFGSGKTGLTYVGLLDSNSLYELRMSYFPHLHRWLLNPGAEALKPTEPGALHQGEAAHHCLTCHSVTLPANSLLPEPRFYGVGCESCHGPGAAHIAAVRSGDLQNLHMERIGAWRATEINNLCAQCHRGPDQVGADQVGLTVTNRFQPYGLMLSRCFLESHDTLSCLTCHNPHRDASTDLKHYEQVCLTCHSGAASGSQHAKALDVRGKICPVNAQTGCIGCHMPIHKVFQERSIPTRMADHYIRAHPQIQ